MATVMRETWTDERLDDLNLKVDRGFELMERRFERVDDRFERVDERFDRVDDRFERVEERLDARFERLYRLIIQLGGGSLAALIGILGVLVVKL